MTTDNHPQSQPKQLWAPILRPPGMKTRPLLRSVLARENLTVITDIFFRGSYWAIVSRADDGQPFPLLCLTSSDPDPHTLRYLIVPEQNGFPDIPPRQFYAEITARCPSPPTDAARTWRQRCEQRYADLDAMPDYPAGTEFTLHGARLRIVEPLGPLGCSALHIEYGAIYRFKREHLLAATIHQPETTHTQRSEPNDQKI